MQLVAWGHDEQAVTQRYSVGKILDYYEAGARIERQKTIAQAAAIASWVRADKQGIERLRKDAESAFNDSSGGNVADRLMADLGNLRMIVPEGKPISSAGDGDEPGT